MPHPRYQLFITFIIFFPSFSNGGFFVAVPSLSFRAKLRNLLSPARLQRCFFRVFAEGEPACNNKWQGRCQIDDGHQCHSS